MKKQILFIVLMLPAFSLVAQPGDREHLRDGRGRIRAAHAAYITQRLELTPAEAEKFWPVYHEFNEKRRKLREDFRDARRSNSDEKNLLELELKMKQDELDLEKDYTRRFEKIISQEKVLKLRQAEADFRRLIFRQIQERRRR